MKLKVVIIVLVVAALGLAIGLFAVKKQADDQHGKDVATIVVFSNQVVDVTKHLDEMGQVNLTLSNDLASTQQQLALDEQSMAVLSNSLAAANNTLADTRTTLAGAQELITNLTSRITDLESQNRLLDQQAETLSNSLAQLTTQIEDTKSKLAVAETGQAFLQRELQKQLAQRADLEHRFNDLDELRSQVKKIKDEMFIARRIQLMKYDTGGRKGAALLMLHPNTRPSERAVETPARSSSGTNAPAGPGSTYDLNVEIGSDGSVKVIPPLGGTNSVSDTNGAAH